MADGKWVVADFSLVKFRRGAVMTTTFATQSRRGGHGTQGYTAPEQWQDFSKADERADVYSLGVLIWELFSPAWPPMERGSLMLAEDLEAVVLTATDRYRDVRYSSIPKLIAAFEQAAGAGPT
jgi:serine/threonine protein kinase